MITVDKQEYENTHGKPPRGYGNWRFHFGGFSYGYPPSERFSVDFESTGMFSEAVKAAKAALRAAQDYPGRFGNSLVVIP